MHEPSWKERNMSSKWHIYMSYPIVVSIILLVVWVNSTLGGERIKYITARVERGDIIATVSASGNINPIVTVQVGTQVSGIIKEYYADFNSEVKKGQLIAKIDPAPYIAAVNQAKANLELTRSKISSAQADVEKAESEINYAKIIYDRHAKLREKNVVSQEELDKDRLAYERQQAELKTKKANLELAQSEVEAAKAALEQVELKLGFTDIYSPLDGIVLSRNVDIGQTVVASLQAPTLFTIAQDLKYLWVHLNVNEADVGMIREGNPTTFYVNAYPETPFHGKAIQIRRAPIVVKNVVTYDVVVGVDNSDMRLMPGMVANATITVAERKGVLKIPNSALRFMPTPSVQKDLEKDILGIGKDQRPVYALSKHKGLKVVPVKTGISNEEYTEIVTGLNEGDIIVVDAQYKK